jgi:hypothetical protein
MLFQSLVGVILHRQTIDNHDMLCPVTGNQPSLRRMFNILYRVVIMETDDYHGACLTPPRVPANYFIRHQPSFWPLPEILAQRAQP